MKINRITMSKGFCYGSDDNAYTYTFVYHGDILNKDGESGARYTSFEEEIKEGTDG